MSMTLIMDHLNFSPNYSAPIALLNDTLEKEYQYYLSFHALVTLNDKDYIVIDKYGAKFLDYFPDTTVSVLQQPFFGSHDVEHKGGFIEDTVKWTKISGQYQAKGNEHVLVFGRLRAFNEVAFKKIGDDGFMEAFYYVDGFTLIPFPELQVHDTVICEGDTLRLQPKVPKGAYYEWSTGQIGGTLEISQPGTYYVSNYSAFDTISDSIVVQVVPKAAQLPSLLACGQATARIDLSSDAATSIEWFDGEANFTRTFSESGRYAYQLQIATCTVVDTLSVLLVPAPDSLPNPINWCMAQERWLTGGTKSYDFIEWNGTKADSLQLSAAYRTIERVVYQQGCVFAQSSEVQQWQDVRYPAIDTSICPGARILLAFDSLEVAYQSKQSLLIIDTGLYQLLYYNGCDTQYLRIRVRPKADCACEVYVPNAFSPNGDGINDSFQLFSSCAIEEQSFSVYNRWGQLLYSSRTSASLGIEASNFPTDAYFFTWTAVLSKQGKKQRVSRSGFFQLLK